MTQDEIGLFRPSATRQRAAALASAYDALFAAAPPELQEQIRPRKRDWDAYHRELQDSYWAAFSDYERLDLYEREFREFRDLVRHAGGDLSRVPEVKAPPSTLGPIVEASRNFGRGAVVMGAGLTMIGGYLVMRFLSSEVKAWMPSQYVKTVTAASRR